MVVEKNHVAGCRHALQFSRKVRTIGRMRATVNLQDQWIAASRIVIRWREIPALYLLTIDLGIVDDLMHLAEGLVAQQVFIERR